MKARIRLLAAALVAAAILPASTPGEVVRLRDGSTLLGRLVRVEGDSLTFRLTIGVPVVIPRGEVVSIAFDDSTSAAVPPAATGAAAPRGTGTVAVSFGARSLSSKISIDKKKDWDEHVRSNYIVVELLLDGVVAYTSTDSTMDKRIYKGHITQLKNDIELQDFAVSAPAGVHQCQIVVRNFDTNTFHDDFDPEPLNVALSLDDVEVRAGTISRIDVTIDRGFLRLGHPKFEEDD